MRLNGLLQDGVMPREEGRHLRRQPAMPPQRFALALSPGGLHPRGGVDRVADSNVLLLYLTQRTLRSALRSTPLGQAA